jgi:hypothetical protein
MSIVPKFIMSRRGTFILSITNLQAHNFSPSVYKIIVFLKHLKTHTIHQFYQFFNVSFINIRVVCRCDRKDVHADNRHLCSCRPSLPRF